MLAHALLFFINIVPRQWSRYDCGLFVCRFAAALHQYIDFFHTWWLIFLLITVII